MVRPDVIDAVERVSFMFMQSATWIKASSLTGIPAGERDAEGNHRRAGITRSEAGRQSVELIAVGAHRDIALTCFL
jgi:hypothetical protein